MKRKKQMLRVNKRAIYSRHSQIKRVQCLNTLSNKISHSSRSNISHCSSSIAFFIFIYIYIYFFLYIFFFIVCTSNLYMLISLYGLLFLFMCLTKAECRKLTCFVLFCTFCSSTLSVFVFLRCFTTSHKAPLRHSI